MKLSWRRTGKAGSPLTFRSAASSFIGSYSINEDATGEAEVNGHMIHVVADGLGGHTSGEVASEITVDHIVARFREEPSLEADLLEKYVLEAHGLLEVEAGTREEPDGVRTTVVLLALSRDLSRWAHVGDSRLYHFRNGTVLGRTLDDSVPEMLRRTDEIEEDEIRGHPDRGRLLQVLGQPTTPRVTVSDPVRVEAGDAFLLCSDGWWEPVTEQDMERFLADSAGPEEWLRKMSEQIEAVARDSQDNYTAAAIFAS